MPDAADQVVDNDQRAMELLEEQLHERRRQQRIADSHRLRDPAKPLHCLECEEVIDPRRLHAFPRASRCARCASEIERAFAEGRL